jgi:hypothetical protein
VYVRTLEKGGAVLGAEATSWTFFGLWTVTGRWELAGMVVIAVAVGFAMLVAAFLVARHFPNQERLFKIIGYVVGILILVDLVIVIEGIAHLIWPNFVDPGA